MKTKKTVIDSVMRNMWMGTLGLILTSGCAGDFNSRATQFAEAQENSKLSDSFSDSSTTLPKVPHKTVPATVIPGETRQSAPTVAPTELHTPKSASPAPQKSEATVAESTVVADSVVDPALVPVPPRAPAPAAEEAAKDSVPKVEVNAKYLLRGMDVNDFEYEGRIKPTVYYKPMYDLDKDESCSDEDRVNLRGADKEVLLQLCPKMKSECLMQGSCLFKLDEGLHSYNYVRSQDTMSLFSEVDTSVCPYGYGLSNI